MDSLYTWLIFYILPILLPIPKSVKNHIIPEVNTCVNTGNLHWAWPRLTTPFNCCQWGVSPAGILHISEPEPLCDTIPHLPYSVRYHVSEQLSLISKTGSDFQNKLMHPGRIGISECQWYSNIDTIHGTLYGVNKGLMSMKLCSLIPPDTVWEDVSLIPSEWSGWQWPGKW